MSGKERILDWWKRFRLMGGAIILFWGLGLYMGWGNGVAPRHQHSPAKRSAKTKKKTLWTCSMHPQIKLPDNTQKCPICFMDLIPMEDDTGQLDPRTLKLSELGKRLAEIRTTRVERRPALMVVGMLGRVAYDETRVKSITAWVGGRLERLFVDYTGVPVRRGDHLVRIYSPELLAAQQELLQAHRAMLRARRQKQAGIVLQTAKMSFSSARQKLALLGLRGWQIRKLLKQGKASVRINIYAPMGGIVIHKKAMEGMYVNTGSHIYTIADLSRVWIKFEAYERDLSWLHVGQKVTFSTSAHPGKGFAGRIVYIDPMLDARTRTVSVRVNVKNPNGLLKPGMFVRGRVQVEVNAMGSARAPDRTGKWVCPMHPEIVRKRKTSCRICGMSLVRIRKHHSHNVKGSLLDPLVIPRTAPLITGRRSLVYVADPKATSPTYTGRVVTLGPQVGDFFVVLKGLKEGEKVVSHGAFKLDSELQLKGRLSMMSPSPGGVGAKKSALARKRPPVSRRFLKQLGPVYDGYFRLWDALAKDQPKAAHRAYRLLFRTLRKRLSARGDASLLWAKSRLSLYDAVKAGRAVGPTDITRQRKHFELVSKAIIALEKGLGHGGMAPYRLAYCPMAFNNRGAYWLQRTKELLNPYFGKKMLRCGTFKQTFVGREGEPIEATRAFLKQLSPIYKAYMTLQDALFRDKFAPAKAAAQALVRAAKAPRSRLLKRGHRRRWKMVQARLRKHAIVASRTKEIKTLRIRFEDLSKDVLQMLYIFGHLGKKSYFEAYCPMAFNNRGAAWVQPQDQRVHNSYFGAKMAYCGTIRRKFPAKQR